MPPNSGTFAAFICLCLALAAKAHGSDEMLQDLGLHRVAKIQNRGTSVITFRLVDADGHDCGGPFKISPNSIIGVPLCASSGTAFKIHDGHDYVTFQANESHVYELYWTNVRWSIRDITTDRLQ